MSMNEYDIKFVEDIQAESKKKDSIIADLHYTLDLRNATINELKTEIMRLKSDREYSA